MTAPTIADPTTLAVGLLHLFEQYAAEGKTFLVQQQDTRFLAETVIAASETIANLERARDVAIESRARMLKIYNAVTDEERTAQELHEALHDAERERDNARCNARILAHAYTTDNRPPARAVAESLAYPVST